MDLASSIQKVTEDIVIKIATNISKTTGEHNLCLAGGVALNCVVNGILDRKNIFKKIWIQPASGDAGGALGAAFSAWHLHLNKERKIIKNRDAMNGSYLGPEFSDLEIEAELNSCGAKFSRVDDEVLEDTIASALENQKAIGWMQGRMEFGPRALGNRSIIADPRSPIMQKQLNLKVKYRESFRPFAPSILKEHVNHWFDSIDDSPYMLKVAYLNKNKRLSLTLNEEKLFGIDKLNLKRSKVPATTHVDYSARIQTVDFHINPKYHSVISKFYEKTQCPIVVNTSFNVRGEPIVCSPTDAFKCFMGTELDILAIGNYILLKEQQKESLKENYENSYELD
jgi:carbamoyltransferase